MEIKIVVNEILPQLSSVCAMVGAKNILPILDNVLFLPYVDETTGDKNVAMTTSDNESWFTVSAPVVDFTGDAKPFCVNAKDILQTLRGLKDENVTLSVDFDTKSICGIYSNGKFTLAIADADDFPTATTTSGETKNVTMKASALSDGLKSVSYAMGNDDLRPVMNGVHVDFNAQSAVFVASDGHRLVKRSVDFNEADNDERGFIINRTPVNTLLNALQMLEADTLVDIKYNEMNVTFTAPFFKLTSRLVEGKYPNYNKVIPDGGEQTAMIRVDAIKTAINRVLPSSNLSSGLVVLSFADNHVTVKAEDIDFAKSASEVVECEYDGEPLVIGFKGAFLLQGVSSLNTERCCIVMNGGNKAAKLLHEDDVNGLGYVAIIMPMIVD